MRVFSPSSELCRLHDLSDGRHVLVAAPEDAEIILIALRWENGIEIEDHELVKLYSNKCFAISVSDLPRYTVHGVYTSVAGVASKFGGRVRSGGYLLHMSPYIQNEHLGSGVGYPKKYFFSFIGRNCHPVRQALLNAAFHRPDVLVEDSSAHFALWDLSRDEVKIATGQQRFCETLKQSKFALCPRGVGPSSIRLFEALKLGVAPVIFSDDWTFPRGPDWRDFSVVVSEKHIGELDRILAEYEPDHETMGKKAADAYEGWFTEKAYFNFLVENCRDIARTQWIREPMAQAILKSGYSVQAAFAKARRRMGLRTRLRRLLHLDKRQKDPF